MVKVLNVTHSTSGGPFSRITSIAREIKKNDIETIIAVPSNSRSPALGVAVKEGFKVYEIPYRFPRDVFNPLVHIKWFLTLFPTILFLARIIRMEKVDLVHNNGMLNIQGSIAAIMTRTRLVWHLNDVATPKIVVKLLLPFARILADCLPVAAENVKKHYFNNGTKKSPVLYAPVDTKEFDLRKIHENQTLKLKKDLDIDLDSRVVGTVGHISPAKGFEYFIMAAAEVAKTELNVKFAIVGPQLGTREDYYKELKRLVDDLGLERKVVFAGYRKDIPDVLSVFDVFVLSSIREACPIVVLEAMSMEKPIVATNVGGVTEQITDKKTGILVPPKDHKSIAEAVLFLLRNPNVRRRMGKKARIEAEKRFCIEKCAKIHEKIYRSLT